MISVVASLGTGAARADKPQLFHIVAFKLKDESEASSAQLVGTCKWVAGRPGTRTCQAWVSRLSW
jgi:hypothetical protein